MLRIVSSTPHTLNIAPLKPLIYNHYYTYVKYFFSKEVFSGYSVWKVVDVSALPECLAKPLGGDDKMTDRIRHNSRKDQNTISTRLSPFWLRFCFPAFQIFSLISSFSLLLNCKKTDRFLQGFRDSTLEINALNLFLQNKTSLP